MAQELTLYVNNDPTTLRIYPKLAEEIGLNESILLLQIDFLIKRANHHIEGKVWTFQSIRDLQKEYFPFWSISTINRAIKSLEDKKLIYVSKFNKAKYDRTRWFALNIEGLKTIENIKVKEGDETQSNQNDTRSDQNDTQSNQNHTTIPDTSSKTSSKTSTDTCSPQDNVTPVGKKDVGCNVNQDIKKILDQREYEKLKPTKNKNVGNITSYNRNMERKGITLGKDEIYTALYLYNSLDCKEHPLLCEYIEHESKLWDFSKTKNPQAVTAQFILECLYNSDTFLHFCKLRKNGDLQEELRYYKCELENSDEDKPLIDLWRES